jgi:photosystem II stability/assembly factor-like uncharacterized protein
MNRRATVLSALLLLAPLARPALAGTDPWMRVGPDEGLVRTFAAAPSRPSTVYAGLGLGGAYRSLDGGTTWSFAGTGLNLHESVRALAVDARRPDVLWSGTDHGLYRSGNGGATWILAHRGGVSALVQNPASGVLYAGSYQTGLMLRSADGGVSWQTLAGSPESVLALAIDPVQPQILYAGNASGLFKSVNGGTSWARLTQGLPNDPIDALAVDPRSRTVYAATTSVIAGQIVFRSDDEGERWTSVDGGMLNYTNALAVDPGRKGAVWAVSSGQLFRSLDQGRTWKRADAGISADGALAVLPGAATLLAGTGSGVFRSGNQGASWSPSSQGMDAATVYGLALDPSRPLRLYAAVPGVYRTASGGDRWSLLPGAPAATDVLGPLATDPHRPGTAYVGLYGGVARTVDAGNHWTSVTNLSCIAPESIAVDPLDSSVVYVAGDFTDAGCGLIPGACSSFRSDDAGQTWTCIQVGQFLAPDPLHASQVYALSGFNVEVSEDRGTSWSHLASGVNFSVLVPDPQRPGTLWAGGPDGLFRSDDGGRIWSLAEGGIPSSAQVTAVVLDPVDKDILYVATLQNGVFKSTDGGATWDALGTGLAGLTVRFLVLDPRTPTTLYAGTAEAGVMKIRQSGD